MKYQVKKMKCLEVQEHPAKLEKLETLEELKHQASVRIGVLTFGQRGQKRRSQEHNHRGSNPPEYLPCQHCRISILLVNVVLLTNSGLSVINHCEIRIFLNFPPGEANELYKESKRSSVNNKNWKSNSKEVSNAISVTIE